MKIPSSVIRLLAATLGIFLLSPVIHAAELLAELKSRAEKGDAAAQTTLAWLHYRGEGAAKDDVESMKWYRKAAEQGDPKGQFILGAMYAVGMGEIGRAHV